MMKNFIRITAIAALTLLTACTQGPIENKRAPGEPGNKIYLVEVDKRWIEVSEGDWDRCEIFEKYPACRTSSDR